MLKKKIIFFLPNYSYGGLENLFLIYAKILIKKSMIYVSLNKNYYKKDLTKFCKEIKIKSTNYFIISKNKKYLKNLIKIIQY